ncbi:sulfotransferase family protein [Sulfurovum sp. CS9]|uniref:sulfotransferase family protein n=1 Tax=Sulfurovum sp. CS9 TaxID=3391146 RepID=UPI0039EB569B
MIRLKIHNYIIRNPKFQYPFYWVMGIIRQLLSLFLNRNIGDTGKYPYLLIVGSGRSGNTLLRRLLMEFGDIYIPPESYVLGSEVISHLNASALNWNDKVDLTLAKIEYYPEFTTFGIDTLRDFSIYAKNFSKDKQQIGTLIIELYKWIAKEKSYSSSWFGDKTPLNTMSLGLTKKLFPKAVYIYIERDGVDVCHSYVQTGTYNNIADAAYRWKNSRLAWQEFKKSLPRNSYVEIKYESMVEDHEQVINHILDILKIPANNHKINVSSSMGDVTMRTHHANVIKTPNKDSIGKGRKLISIDERSTLKLIINDELEQAGYEKL